jgi:hypothetical protein
MKTLPSIVQLLQWKDECREECIDWHKALKHFKTKREKEAMQAGFDKGFIEALRLLQLHADLKFSTQKEA